MTTDLVIEAHGLVKTFGTTRAVDGVDLAVPRGTILGVLGPNGAGKTTTVRMLATLLIPDAGTARIMGRDVVKSAAAVRRTIGLTGQYASVDEDLSGRQNMEMIAALLDFSRRDAKARATELLAAFGLADASDRPAKTYSGGMRRRLDLAASLVGRPEIVFLDEPTTGLDPTKREEMWGVVRGLVSDGSTVMLTTQYLDEADALADEITVIDHGRVIAHDTPAGLKRVVGGQTLEVSPVDADRVDEVAAILTDIVPGVRVESPRRGVLSLPVTDDGVLLPVIQRLSSAGIAVTELGLRLPSLDDVFFLLTGQPSGADTSTLKEVA